MDEPQVPHGNDHAVHSAFRSQAHCEAHEAPKILKRHLRFRPIGVEHGLVKCTGSIVRVLGVIQAPSWHILTLRYTP